MLMSAGAGPAYDNPPGTSSIIQPLLKKDIGV